MSVATFGLIPGRFDIAEFRYIGLRFQICRQRGDSGPAKGIYVIVTGMANASTVTVVVTATINAAAAAVTVTVTVTVTATETITVRVPLW